MDNLNLSTNQKIIIITKKILRLLGSAIFHSAQVIAHKTTRKSATIIVFTHINLANESRSDFIVKFQFYLPKDLVRVQFNRDFPIELNFYWKPLENHHDFIEV
jgi:hypothetical protein